MSKHEPGRPTIFSYPFLRIMAKSSRMRQRSQCDGDAYKPHDRNCMKKTHQEKSDQTNILGWNKTEAENVGKCGTIAQLKDSHDSKTNDASVRQFMPIIFLVTGHPIVFNVTTVGIGTCNMKLIFHSQNTKTASIRWIFGRNPRF